jgi:hypothetical protein
MLQTALNIHIRAQPAKDLTVATKPSLLQNVQHNLNEAGKNQDKHIYFFLYFAVLTSLITLSE